MMAALLGAVASLAVGLLAFIQWYISNQRQRRQRDVELLRWGDEVINLMAELENLCDPIGADAPPLEHVRVQALAGLASALVDRGRLFFSNVKQEMAPAQSEQLGAFGGFRPRILDEVLRAHYVARYLSMNGRANGSFLRQQVWTARGRFVTCLQAEMGHSLKRSPESEMGEEIDQDPTTWAFEAEPEHAEPSSRLFEVNVRRFLGRP